MTRLPAHRPRQAVAPHPYAGDGLTDPRGADRCARAGCGLPRSRADVHEMPVVAAEVVEAEARRMGEVER